MITLKCKMCGGDLTFEENTTVCECECCGLKQTVPKVDDEKKAKLFDRANRFRMANEFDKAANVYEGIIEEDDTDAEAYWGLMLCKFGIEYVDDPATGDKIPTCHRSSFDSFMEDEDFEMVMSNADSISRNVYREQAKQIEEIRKGIIEVSGKEQPYDIFICYKETDENGDRTIDSVLAQDVYDALTDKGYRVFFSRISLEDKLGTEYEPYIFAALNSAKLMLAFGTTYDYYNAVWVKNEWRRYLKIMAKDKGKYLIPCFKDIDAYDIPKEFAKLQSQDMGKVGAMQDLLRGIDKIFGKDSAAQNQGANAQPVIQQVVQAAGGSNVGALIQRGFMAIEDEEWDKADAFFEDVLNVEPQNAEAYLGKLMAEYKVSQKERISELKVPFDESKNYKKVVRFGGEELKNELKQYLDDINARNISAVSSCLKKANFELRRGNRHEADLLFDEAIQIDSSNAEAYLGKFLVKINGTLIQDIKDYYISNFELSKNIGKMLEACPQDYSLNELIKNKYYNSKSITKENLAIIRENIEKIINVHECRMYFSQVEAYKDTKNECLEAIDNDEYLSEAQKKATDTLKQELENVIEEITVYFTSKIDEAMEVAKNNRDIAKTRYKEKLETAENEVEEFVSRFNVTDELKHALIEKKSIDEIRGYLEKGININEEVTVDNSKISLLALAMYNDASFDVVKALVEYGADTNYHCTVDEDVTVSILSLAVMSEDMDIFNLILNKNPDLEQSVSVPIEEQMMGTAIFCAIVMKQSTMAIELIKKGANLSAQCDSNIVTSPVLNFSLLYGQLEVVKELLNRGVNPNSIRKLKRSNQTYYPMMDAFISKNFDKNQKDAAIALLCENGADFRGTIENIPFQNMKFSNFYLTRDTKDKMKKVGWEPGFFSREFIVK